VAGGGSLGRYDGVVLLTGIGGGAHLDLTISADTAIFVPIVNIESSVYEDPPFHGDDDESLRENSVKLLDETTGLFAEIDGVPVDDLASYRFISPSFTFGPLPPGNLLNAPVGTTSLSVDAGYYLLLTPLSVGTHTLHFGGINDAVGSSIDTTYTITVVPEPASLTMLAIAGLGSMVYRRRGRAQR